MKKVMVCFVLLLAIQSYAFGDFVVPGYTVQTYAQVQVPEQMAFDSQGFLYTGNGNNDWLLIGDYDTDYYVQQIAPGGAPVSNYGNSGFYDADAVAVDVDGSISGTEGTLLVGCGYSGRLYGILPDQSVIPIFTDMASYNPSKMIFDSTGRLLIMDPTSSAVFQTSGSDPTTLFSTPTPSYGMAVDASDRIFVSDAFGTIRVYDENGEPIGTLPPLDSNPTPHNLLMAFTNGNDLWEAGLYVLNDGDGNLSRLDLDFDSEGIVTGIIPIGKGYDPHAAAADMIFGPDGALYFSNYSYGEILRIVPEPTTISLLLLGGLAAMRKRKA